MGTKVSTFGGIILPLIALTFLAQAQTAIHAQAPCFQDCFTCPNMVVVPPGRFMMGSADLATTTIIDPNANFLFRWFVRWRFGRALSQTKPQHEVVLAHAVAIGRYEVTRGEFATFAHATGYKPERGCYFYDYHGYRPNDHGSWLNPGFAQSDNDPVVCVNINDVEAYISWLNRFSRQTGFARGSHAYRLPSEAEWEYAARAGTTTIHWWGNDMGVGNADCLGCGSPWDGKRTAPVKSFPDNPFGISGVLGNASEWISDCWHTDYDLAPANGSSWSTGNCNWRVSRGYSAVSDARYVRSSFRSASQSSSRFAFTGFRVAADLQADTP